MAMKTIKFKLKPTKEQEEKIQWTLMMCRNLYNNALEQRKFTMKRRKSPFPSIDKRKNCPP